MATSDSTSAMGVLQQRQCLGTAIGLQHGVAQFEQAAADHASHLRIVVDQQRQALCHGGRVGLASGRCLIARRPRWPAATG